PGGGGRGMPERGRASGRSFVVGMSGGSGVRYALRLIDVLARAGAALQLVVSDAGRRVLRHEHGLPADRPGFDPRELVAAELRDRITVFDVAAVESTPASGSAAIDGVVVC